MTEPPARGTPERNDRPVLIVVSAVLVGALVAIGVYAWWSLRDTGMSAGGYLALTLGILGTAALAGGLMALLFYSQRRGYDDAAGGGSGEQD
jgi:predicted phage tail protein